MYRDPAFPLATFGLGMMVMLAFVVLLALQQHLRQRKTKTVEYWQGKIEGYRMDTLYAQAEIDRISAVAPVSQSEPVPPEFVHPSRRET